MSTERLQSVGQEMPAVARAPEQAEPGPPQQEHPQAAHAEAAPAHAAPEQDAPAGEGLHCICSCLQCSLSHLDHRQG